MQYCVDKKHLRHMLAQQTESVGVVKRSKGQLVFDNAAPLRRTAVTFHTHNVRDKNGGFDPPSRKDMSYLLTYSQKGHFVVTHRGFYYVKISCRVRKPLVKSLIKSMENMQHRISPGYQYNARYMKEVNSLAPACLKVTFTPWYKMCTTASKSNKRKV